MLVNQWASDHCHTLAGGTPILALDMYEHSYHMDFGAKAATYVDTFMEVVRWRNVDQLFTSLAHETGAKRQPGNGRRTYHACISYSGDLRPGDHGHPRQCPGDRLEEGRRSGG